MKTYVKYGHTKLIVASRVSCNKKLGKKEKVAPIIMDLKLKQAQSFLLIFLLPKIFSLIIEKLQIVNYCVL